MIDPNEPLITFLRSTGGCKKGGSYKLASGKESPYYVNCRSMLLDPHGLYMAMQVLDYHIRTHDLEYDSIGGVDMAGRSMVAGLMMGHGCGLFTAGGLYSPSPNLLTGFVIRKDTKQHGLMNVIDGEVGKKPLLIDDVATSGQSLKTAILKLKEEKGVMPTHVVVLVDREEGAKELLSEMGIGLLHCVTRRDLIDDIVNI